MARKLNSNHKINGFISTVIRQANHHAKRVEFVIQPLSDIVRERLNLEVDSLEVYERNGQLARTCWITLNSKRYVFTYNYEDEKIDLKEKSLQGKVIFRFDNSVSLNTIRKVIEKL